MSKDCVLFVEGGEILCKINTMANFQKVHNKGVS